MKQNRHQNIMFEAALKPIDTDPVDLLFFRPVGYRCALFFHKLGLLPNTITVVSILLGISSGFFLYFEDIWYNIIGILLLFCTHLLDCTDGQLARMIGRYSRLGRILDHLSGCAWSVSVFMALCLRLMNSGWDFSVFFLALITGYFHFRQASAIDYYRNFYYLFSRKELVCEFEYKTQLHLKYKRLSWKADFYRKFFFSFYLQYMVYQERFTPDMQELRRLLKKRFGNDIPDWLRIQFEEKSLPLMMYSGMLSFNIRIITLFIAVLFDALWIYFLFELTILNAILFYLIYRHEKVCRYFIGKLNRI